MNERAHMTRRHRSLRDWQKLGRTDLRPTARPPADLLHTDLFRTALLHTELLRTDLRSADRRPTALLRTDLLHTNLLRTGFLLTLLCALSLGLAQPALAQMGMGDPMGSGPAPEPSEEETLPKVKKDIADDPIKVFERAEYAFSRKDWPLAIAHYQHVRDRFPYQLELAANSELRLADIAYARKRWAEARALYRNFIRFRPSHPRVDYASLRTGLAAYNEIPGRLFLHPPAIERDQAEAREALSLLREYVRSFPNSEHLPEAKEAIAKCEDFLAQHELYVARFYTSRKKWRGVLLRVDTLLRHFPRSEALPEALFLAVKAHVALDEKEEAYAALAEMEHREVEEKVINKTKAYLAKRAPM